MKLSCCCGVVIGFVLAMILSAALCWYFYAKNDPEAAADNIEEVEEKWENIKNGGDEVIKKVKKASSCAPKETQKIKEKIEDMID